MPEQTINWIQIFQVGGLAGILAGIISAFVNGGIKEFLEHRERKRKARFLALQISLILENYYHACAERLYDIENFRGSNGHGGSNEVGLPDIADYPSDPSSWLYLKSEIADEVLSFPSVIRSVNSGISFNVWFDSDMDGPDPRWTLQPLYETAFRTAELVRRVRQEQGLPATNRTLESEKHLNEKQQQFLSWLRERERRERVGAPLI